MRGSSYWLQWSHTERLFPDRSRPPVSGTRCGRPARRLGQRPGRVGEGALLPHQLDQRVRRLHAQRAHLPRRRPAPGRPARRTGRSASPATCATPYGTLPARLEKSKAPSPVTPGRRRGPARRSRTASATRPMPGSRVAPSSSSAKPRPPAAPAPFSSDVRRSVATASSSSDAVDRRQPLLGDALLRPEDLGRAEQAGQRVVDVAGGDQLARPPAARGRPPGRPAVTPRRPAAPASRGRSAVAPSAASSPAPPSLVPLPPRPTTIRRAPASSAAAAARRRRSVRGRLGALAARSGAGRTPGRSRRTPCRRRAAAWPAPGRRTGPRTVTASSSPPERGVQHVDEPRAAVGHRREVELVVGRVTAASRRRSPRAASTAVSVPANLSGATRTRMRGIVGHDRRVRAVADRRRRAHPADARRRRRRPPSGSAPRASTSSTCRMLRRSAARAPSCRPPTAARDWIARTRHFLDTDPGGLLGRRGRPAACSASPRRSTARSSGAWRRTPSARACRAAGIGKPLLAAALHHGRGLAARDALGVVGPEGGAPLPAGRLLAAPADVPDRHRRPRPRSRWSRRSARARAGDIDLMDSIDRRTRGAAHGPDHELMLRLLAAAGLRHDDRVGLRLPRRGGRRRAARGDQPAYGDPAAVGRRSPTPRREATVAPRHGGQRVGARRRDRGPARRPHQRGTSALRGMAPPAPYLHNGALL